MAPLFSIVIPVYNTVRELERCVNSITMQKYSDFEVILVDDGSTDGSGELCDRLSGQDGRIRTIHKQNGGCSEARNTGIRAAQGEYLMFVDSDDMWDDENALGDLAAIIAEQKQVDVVCFGVAIYNEDGSLVKIRKPTLPEAQSPDKADLLKHLIYTNQYFSTSYVKVLKRDYFLENNLFFVKGLLSEDIEWSARVLIHSRSLAIYPSAFYKRIQRSEGSITSAIGKKNIMDILSSIESGVAYAEKHSEDERLLALYREYWAYQYAMLIGLAPVMKEDVDFEAVMLRMEKLAWLLKYDNVRKVKLVRICKKVVGLRLTSALLSRYYRIRR